MAKCGGGQIRDVKVYFILHTRLTIAITVSIGGGGGL